MGSKSSVYFPNSGAKHPTSCANHATPNTPNPGANLHSLRSNITEHAPSIAETLLLRSAGPNAGFASVGGQTPLDRQSMGDWQFEEIWRPKRQISSNCQSPVVCLSPCRSIREYIPRFIWLNLGMHSEVLAQSGNTFRGSPLLEGAHAGFASVGAQPLLGPL